MESREEQTGRQGWARIAPVDAAMGDNFPYQFSSCEERLQALERRTASLVLRTKPSDLLRTDRNRR
jgi:hypothetical protein